MSTSKSGVVRREILDELARVGRDHSDATVLFHATIAGLLDLHPTDYKVVGILERSGPLSAGDIARRSGLAAASVTNLIDRLEKKRFVRRVADPADGRRVMVEVVPDRIAGAARLFASTRRSLAELYDRYSDHELSIIANFLRYNAERLRAETGKLAGAEPAAKQGPRPAVASRPRREGSRDHVDFRGPRSTSKRTERQDQIRRLNQGNPSGGHS